MKDFKIKTGFKENPPLTFSENPGDYWIPERIKNSHFFQFHVYELAKKIALKTGAKDILDIGSGPGTKLKKFFDLKQFQITLFDQPGMEKVVAKTIGDVEFFGVNLENRDFSNQKQYDLIICADVIEHLEDPDSLLEIIKKHLKQSGTCIVSTPDRDMCRGLKNMQSPNKAHVREWNKPELIEYLKSRNFNVEKHYNFPLKNLLPFKFWLSQLPVFYRRRNPKNWYGCQAIVITQ